MIYSNKKSNKKKEKNKKENFFEKQILLFLEKKKEIFKVLKFFDCFWEYYYRKWKFLEKNFHFKNFPNSYQKKDIKNFLKFYCLIKRELLIKGEILFSIKKSLHNFQFSNFFYS
ncbi:hypothetical protein HAN_2g207 (nucleomorph) [Hemiselmis andersenii]|uniref:Uncharacterized protein n=1 Tax=Hemiselmis andersenii TaxID=464988 RepID=A9BKM9_HEMAN|nr:hypothetical protein HAN_2g207 [Hemiselmis andersenii]ABW98034.1 hypothetical protein HAN_2g207 [Hemiselmis andersenii]